jgi:hypothetical protein
MMCSGQAIYQRFFATIAEHRTALESSINRGDHEGDNRDHPALPSEEGRCCQPGMSVPVIIGAILIETLAREALGRQIRQVEKASPCPQRAAGAGRVDPTPAKSLFSSQMLGP